MGCCCCKQSPQVTPETEDKSIRRKRRCFSRCLCCCCCCIWSEAARHKGNSGDGHLEIEKIQFPGHHLPKDRGQIRKRNLFISYSWAFRKDDVQKMAKYLKQQNYDVWLDIERMHGFIYQQMAMGVKEADVVVIFFSKNYTQEDSNSYKELEFATMKKKKILLVRLDKDYSPDDAFALMTGNLLWVDYGTSGEMKKVGKEICRQISLILGTAEKAENNKEKVPHTMNTILRPRFATMAIPRLSDKTFQNSWQYQLEREAARAIIDNCNSSGVLFICGERGSGRTTLISRVICGNSQSLSINADLPKLLAFTAVIWLNCGLWSKREPFNESARAAFSDRLISQVKWCDPTFYSDNPIDIVPHFKSKGGGDMNVLFVLNQVYNHSLLKYFLDSQKQHQSSFSCCILTEETEISATDYPNQTLKMSRFNKEEIVDEILRNFENFNGALSYQQFASLAEFCFGSPLIASTMTGLFRNLNLQSVTSVYEEVTTLPDIIRQNFPALSEVDMRSKNLSVIFGLLFRQLSVFHRNCFYAFLFFDPEEPVLLQDLTLLWGSSQLNCDAVLSALEESYLVTSIDRRNGSHLWVSIHELFFDIALDQAAATFNLAKSSRQKQLELIRFKLATSQLPTSDTNNTSRDEICIFEAVKLRRLSILKRVVENLSSNDLSTICTMKHVEYSGRSFLHFLYYSCCLAEIRPVLLEEGEELCDRLVAQFYWLLRRILAKLLRDLKAFEILDTLNTPAANPLMTNSASFLTDLLQDHALDPHHQMRSQLVKLLDQLMDASTTSDEFGNSEDRRQSTAIESDDGTGVESLTLVSRNNFQKDRRPIELDGDIVFADVKEDLIALPSSLSIELLKDSFTAFPPGHSDELNLPRDKSTKIWNDSEQSRLMRETKRRDVRSAVNQCKKDPQDVVREDNDRWTPLMKAAQVGDIYIAKMLLETNCRPIFHRDNQSRTALMIAAQHGQLEMVKFLDRKDRERRPTSPPHYGERETNCQADKYGWTALMFACENGHLEVARYLAIERPDELRRSGGSGVTPLMLSCLIGNEDLVKFLVQQDNESISKQDNNGWTPLLYAASKGHLNMLKFLQDQNKTALVKRSKRGLTALMIASQSGHLEVVKFICKESPEMAFEAVESKGFKWTAVAYAILAKRWALTQFFCDLSQDNVRMAVFSAAMHGQLGTLARLFERYQDVVNQCVLEEQSGWTPLMAAAQNGHIDVVEYLVLLSEDIVTLKTQDGITATMIAAQNGHLQVVEFFYSKNAATLTQEDRHGKAPLVYAAMTGQMEIVKFVCQKNFSVMMSTKSCGLALFFASFHNHLEVVRFLCLANAKAATWKNQRQHTALMAASQNGHHAVVNFLADRFSADLISLSDGYGRTATMLAAENGHSEVVRSLCHIDSTAVLQEDAYRRTALMYAALNGHLPAVDLLCDLFPKALKRKDLFGWTPLMAAVYKNQVKVIDYLLSKKFEEFVTKTSISLASKIATKRGYAQLACELAKRYKQRVAQDDKLLFLNGPVAWSYFES